MGPQQRQQWFSEKILTPFATRLPERPKTSRISCVRFLAPRANSLRRHPAAIVVAVVLLLWALGLGGCAKPVPPANTLRVGIGAEVATLDPHLMQGVAEARILSSLYEGLVLPYPDRQNHTSVSAGVAERWEISPDGCQYTFYLRPNARWSNGDTLTSVDFSNSWKRSLLPQIASPNATFFDPIEGAKNFRNGHGSWTQVGIYTPDLHTLIIRLQYPAPQFLQTLAHGVFYPLHGPTLAKFGATDRRGINWSRPGELVSNGPFRLVEHAPYQSLAVEQNHLYRGTQPPKLRRIEFYPIDNRSGEEMAFLSGVLDITLGLPLNKVEAYKNDPRLRIDPALQIEYVLLNTRRAPLDDVRVRRALSMALDRNTLCEKILRAGQIPAFTFIPPALRTPSNPHQLAQDPITAKALLPKLGTGDKLIYRFNSSEARKAVAEALQSGWEKSLGLSIGLENLEWKTFLGARTAGDYTLARAGWSADIPDASNFLALFLSDNPNNSTGWKNANYDLLVHERNFEAAEAILLSELPCLPLYFNPNIYLLSPRVEGWESNPMDLHDWRKVKVK